MTTWRISVFSTETDELLAEHEMRQPDRNAVRAEWHLPPRVPIMELLIDETHLPFVNALLDSPLQLEEGQEAYLGETADYEGETVDE